MSYVPRLPILLSQLYYILTFVKALNPCQLKDRLALFFDATPENITNTDSDSWSSQIFQKAHKATLNKSTVESRNRKKWLLLFSFFLKAYNVI